MLIILIRIDENLQQTISLAPVNLKKMTHLLQCSFIQATVKPAPTGTP
jgi:hypothetical protein